MYCMAINLKKLEKISKALGDVNRLRILNHIAANGGIGHCSAIQGCVDLAQPSVSHHIKILIEAELIEAEKEGRHYKYILNQDNLNEYLKAIASQVLPGKGSVGQEVCNELPPEKPSPAIITAGVNHSAGGTSRGDTSGQDAPAGEEVAPVSPDKKNPGKITHG